LIYRPEIDGLRALALIAVVLFHAGLDAFSGGYLSVDIFFVISGYLITQILLHEFNEGHFNALRFYERRTRRLLPALALVVLTTCVLAVLLFDARLLPQFGNSVMSVPLFLSNFYFWRSTDYFDPSEQLQPLLHTWSLSVEAQLYLLAPVLLFVGLKLGTRGLRSLILLVLIGSLGLAEWGWRHYPSANFYFPTSRLWEFLTGSLAAMLVIRNTTRAANVLSLAGLVAVVASVLFFDTFSPTPGLATALPVIGAALLLLNAREGTAASRLLRQAALVRIGQISYSGYLWHFPVLVFAAYLKAGDLSGLSLPPPTFSTLQLIAILVITAVLSYLTWRFVETPCRRMPNASKQTRGRPFLLYSSATLGVLFILGLVCKGLFTDHQGPQFAFDSDWVKAVRLHECLLQEPEATAHASHCTNGQGVLLIGDSHAGALSIGLGETLQALGIDFSQLTQSGCPPLKSIPRLEYRKNCNTLNEQILRSLSDTRYSLVILHAAWLHEHYPLSAEDVADRLAAYLAELREAVPQATIYTVGAVPRWRYGPVGQNQIEQADNIYKASNAYLAAQLNKILEERIQQTGDTRLHFFNPVSALCETASARCLIAAPDKESQIPEYSYIDAGHLATSGSRLLAEALWNEVRKLDLP
jgi:peptidoglycan/LPS O-acetylase OafA/YrhL/lysophospholipase L1-like esterase